MYEAWSVYGYFANEIVYNWERLHENPLPLA